MDPRAVQHMGDRCRRPPRLHSAAGVDRRRGPRGGPAHAGRRVRGDRMRLTIPDMALVALVGVSGSGKSTFAAKHFRPTQVLSSDFFRGLVADDENDQSASAAAFDALHYVAAKRLEAGRITVIDATNTQRVPRKAIVD